MTIPSPAPERSMYDEIGGADTVRRIVERLYYHVRMDDRVFPVFVGVDLAVVKSHMVKLISQILGGPRDYSGRELEKAHAHLHITDVQYERVGDYLIAALYIEHAPVHVINAVGHVLLESRPLVVTGK